MVRAAPTVAAQKLADPRDDDLLAPNNSDAPRTLFICVYSAADAMPVSPSPVPTRDQGRIVRGEDRGRVRSSGFDIPMPELPKGASFFDQQQTS